MKKLGPVESVGIVDVICDLCAKSCFVQEDTDHESGDYEYATIEANFGYYSGGMDGDVYATHICHLCFPKVVEALKSVGVRVVKTSMY